MAVSALSPAKVAVISKIIVLAALCSLCIFSLSDKKMPSYASFTLVKRKGGMRGMEKEKMKYKRE